MREHPGIHLRELQRLTGIRWGALQYHTSVLVGSGHLTAARSGKSRVLACDVHRLGDDELRAIHFLRGRGSRKVAEALARGPPRTQRDIAAEAGVSTALASRYVRAMVEMGLARVLAGGPRRYAPSPRLQELLAAAPPRTRS